MEIKESTPMKSKFPLGTIVMTRGVSQRIKNIKDRLEFSPESADHLREEYANLLVGTWLARHSKGDWGECCDEDKSVNDEALKVGNRLMSVYLFPDEPVGAAGKVWVITEWDRSVTTLLLPEEY